MPVADGKPVLRDFVPLIRWMMVRKDFTHRKLASLTGISKTRLGLLLHFDPRKRSPMTFDEVQLILNALGTDMVEAYICTKTWETIDTDLLERHDAVIPMVCDAFVDLPQVLIVVLEELEGIEGTEIRRDWAPAVQRAILARLVEEVKATLNRRARLVESDDFRI